MTTALRTNAATADTTPADDSTAGPPPKVPQAPSGELVTTKPFSRLTALSHGLTDTDLRGPAFRQVLHGVYVARLVPDTLVTRVRAALVVAPKGAVASHETASRLWASDATGSTFVHLAISGSAQMLHDQVKLHRYTYELGVARRHGVPLTSPERTYLHMAVRTDLVGLVALGDQLVRRGVVTPEELVRAAKEWGGHGGRLAREAAPYVRIGAESARESQLRLLLVLANLPEPELQHEVTISDSKHYRLDSAYPWWRIGIEYDGRWHSRPQQQEKDRVRRELLSERFGWRIIVVDADRLYKDPAGVIEEVRAAIVERGGTPDRLRGRWRRYFGELRVAPSPNNFTKG